MDIAMLRIIIVDEHHIFRQGLRRLLESAHDISIVSEAATEGEAQKVINQNDCEVVLLGIGSSGISSIELVKQLKVTKPHIGVLIISVAAEEHYCERFIRAGASGFLSKESAVSELVDAVRKVASGRKYVTPSLVDCLSDFPVGESNELLATLSDREHQVMVSLAAGKRMKQTAAEMSLSIKTVSTYHSRLLQKLNLENDAQLIRFAIENGIVKDGLPAREVLIRTEIGVKAASAAATIRQLWQSRKDVILVIVIVSVIAWIVLTYIIGVLI
jgi:DNA-binding NarL/FixJ family response regulator